MLGERREGVGAQPLAHGQARERERTVGLADRRELERQQRIAIGLAPDLADRVDELVLHRGRALAAEREKEKTHRRRVGRLSQRPRGIGPHERGVILKRSGKCLDGLWRLHRSQRESRAGAHSSSARGESVHQRRRIAEHLRVHERLQIRPHQQAVAGPVDSLWRWRQRRRSGASSEDEEGTEEGREACRQGLEHPGEVGTSGEGGSTASSARRGTRTPTGVTPPAPKAGASTNSAILAGLQDSASSASPPRPLAFPVLRLC